MGWTCEKCGLYNPQSASTCDCGRLQKAFDKAKRLAEEEARQAEAAKAKAAKAKQARRFSTKPSWFKRTWKRYAPVLWFWFLLWLNFSWNILGLEITGQVVVGLFVTSGYVMGQIQKVFAAFDEEIADIRERLRRLGDWDEDDVSDEP